MRTKGKVYRMYATITPKRDPVLSPHRGNNPEQLLRHREFALAFDAFLETPALLTDRKYLLTGMRISTKMYFLIFQITQLLLGSLLLSLGHGFRGLR